MKCRIQMNHIQVNDIFIIDIHIDIQHVKGLVQIPVIKPFNVLKGLLRKKKA